MDFMFNTKKKAGCVDAAQYNCVTEMAAAPPTFSFLLFYLEKGAMAHKLKRVHILRIYDVQLQI
jgi:hypothetical protein